MKLKIKKWGINGEGIAYVHKKPIFIDDAIVDELVDGEITEENDRFGKAKIKKVLEPSPRRRYPMCGIWKECGGCPIMHMDMKGQLRMKAAILQEALRKYANYTRPILPIIKNPSVLAYRNACKLRFFNEKGKIEVGLYEKGSNHVIKMERCLIHEKGLEQARSQIVDILNQYDQKAYSKKEECGYRTLVMKEFDRKIQVILVTGKMMIEKEIINQIMKIDNVVSLWQSVKTKDENEIDIFGYKMIHLAGEEKMEIGVCGLHLNLLPRSFFQLNTKQAQNLYEVVKAWTPRSKTIVEAYCGIGAMSLLVAEKAKKVIGIESIEDAVRNAQENAEKNGTRNVNFICGDAAQELKKINKERSIDTLIVDPPRSGLDQPMKETILHSNIQTIIYVSCNPSTLAKDLGVLNEKYKIERVQPVDMFSQTPHVECVVLMSRVEK
ncbi:23S rRNA (uracil-5-)-methyltransferase RumA [Firmicutes bacterium M10-2]|nr:23S rRNA (uracil-5-)-methyltransferase RumA [Firmicutes bacterium M10-2]